MERDDQAHRRRKPTGVQGGARQLVLDLVRDPSYDPEEFLVSSSNADAHAAIARWPAWPTRMLILMGPPGSGKSHLGAIWAARAGAHMVERAHIASQGCWTGRVVALLEDCGKGIDDQASLFHLINMVGETNGWLLMTAHTSPAAWGITIPDLLSRLRLAETVAIHRPDGDLVKAVIVKLFTDRQIQVDEDVVNYAALHCEQSLDAVGKFVAAVDEDALATGRRITRPLAAQTMARLTSRLSDADE